MNWFLAHEKELADVFAEAEGIISAFPAPLDHLGLAYLATFDGRKEESTKNYICYLLPYWMKDISDLPPESMNKLSLANVFVMLYYFIQDDIMDSAKGEHKDKLPLANLFHMHFISIYREMFPAASPFWGNYETYIMEWSEAVSNEQQSDYFHHDISKVAKKASPVKNASTGALLLTNQAHLIPVVTAAVEQTLITLQMLDDWADWEEDLEEGSYNCLLASMRKQLRLSTDSAISPEMVKQQLYVHDFLDFYGQIAITHHEQLLDLQISMTQMINFHDSLVQNIQKVALEIKENRKMLASGGFYYFLSKTS
ncbi:hypothetical protein [Paenibacillus sp. Soil724D2]|uniref:hypothetical protein n=1 Tax=Paenibacillus sp. (strain Soil724D2) TaxID=1736392 RepID=UPI000715FB44|nr:hypothetical protein [Paenibacillus sp. Soil724D2]KRE50771.1 hypothetical protein ASG85_19605 [Paenibacillus sp. Soil724D2]